ncbi:MAG: NADPH:quinone reductase [Planctomycetaceae bacterium]|jgi:NADPH2:quinone reductase|nr:NADPH:quinone reductase [Planctomycetaceae bacterium]
MKAAYIRQTGRPDVIEFGEVETPSPGENDLLIRVHAAAVNPIDTYIRSGAVQFELPQPFIPGCDAAGVVESVGAGVQRFAVGDRVWCTNQGLLGRQGTFAEQIAVDEQWCFPLPDAVSYEDAAASALVGVTAHLGLYREARLQRGETILVIGGSGGVGSMVVQMAKATGATVIATAGSELKCQRCRDLGADVVINYRQASIEQMVRQAAPGGVNVFWETRREPDFDLAVNLMSDRGRMVLMAGRDARPCFPVGPFYVKECSLHGFAMFKATSAEMLAAAEEINRWLATGMLQATIAHRLPLEKASEAHRLQEEATLDGNAEVGGKIVISVK